MSSSSWFCSACTATNDGDAQQCRNLECMLLRKTVGVDALASRRRRVPERGDEQGGGEGVAAITPSTTRKISPRPRVARKTSARATPNWRGPPASPAARLVQEVKTEVVVQDAGTPDAVSATEGGLLVQAIEDPVVPTDVQQAADTEGLTLVLAPGTASGFKSVCLQPTAVGYHFTVQWWDKCRQQTAYVREADGSTTRFHTAAEAALCYARMLGGDESARQARAAPRPGSSTQAEWTESALFMPRLSAAEVAAAAEQEGLVVMRDSKYATGFRGVSRSKSRRSDSSCFIAKAYHPYRYLGTFASADEAALCIARHERTRKMARTTSAAP